MSMQLETLGVKLPSAIRTKEESFDTVQDALNRIAALCGPYYVTKPLHVLTAPAPQQLTHISSTATLAPSPRTNLIGEESAHTQPPDSPIASPTANADLESGLPSTTLDALRETLATLYLQLGGPDYRAMAISTIIAAEKLTSVSQEYLSRARDGVIPAAPMMLLVETMNNLAAETRELFGLHRRSSTATAAGKPAAGGKDKTKPSTPDTLAERSKHPVFVDDTTGELAMPARAAASLVQADENELYDMSVLHSSCAHLASNDDDDTVAVLKNRNRQLHAKAKHLEHEVQRLEGHIHRLHEQFHALYEPLMTANTELEARVRLLDKQVANGDGAPRFEAEAEAEAVPPVFRPGETRDIGTAPAGSGRSRGSALQSAPPPSSTPSPTRPKKDRGFHNPPSPKLDAFGTPEHSPTISPSAAASTINHFSADALSHLYEAQFHRKGWSMLWNVINLVFKQEYDQPPPSPAARSASNAGASATDGIDDEALRTFCDAFQSQVLETIADVNKLRAQIASLETPLRAAYIANCLSTKTKTNSGVMQLLNEIVSERDVQEFGLKNNLVGDSRLVPLIPLFARMYRLQSLDLSNNGLKNRSVKLLCDTLAHHKSITHLDLSGNPVSRDGGKALLHLVTALPHLTSIVLDNTQLETALKERIEQRALLNQSAMEGTATTNVA